MYHGCLLSHDVVKCILPYLWCRLMVTAAISCFLSNRSITCIKVQIVLSEHEGQIVCACICIMHSHVVKWVWHYDMVIVMHGLCACVSG